MAGSIGGCNALIWIVVLWMLSKKERIDKNAEFWTVLARGSTLQAACDAVGVNRRTGRHWRQETGGRIPRKKPALSGRYLCLEERLHIADLHLAGNGVRELATLGWQIECRIGDQMAGGRVDRHLHMTGVRDNKFQVCIWIPPKDVAGIRGNFHGELNFVTGTLVKRDDDLASRSALSGNWPERFDATFVAARASFYGSNCEGSWDVAAFTFPTGQPMVDIFVNYWLTIFMNEIQRAQIKLEHARQHLRDVVTRSRQEGQTWAEIGKTLGMSRQAAFKRFADPTDPTSGEKVSKRSLQHIADLTEQVFRFIAQGDHERLQGLMHPRTREELPPSLIADTWKKALSEVGTLDSCHDTHAELPGGDRIDSDERALGTVIGQTMLHCEAGELLGRVAINEQLEVVGVLIAPTDHGPLPF